MSQYFSDDEFRCHGEEADNVAKYGSCGCGGAVGPDNAGMSQDLQDLLDRIRETCGVPLTLDCAYRCPKHNKDVGGEAGSYHMKGMAADIAVPDGFSIQQLHDIAEQCGATGIGMYSWGCHVDVRPAGEGYQWDYR